MLGRGSMGAARRDAILQTVLARVRAEAPSRRSWRWAFAGFGAAATATAVLLFVGPRFASPALSPFRAKGTANSSAPSAEIDCLGATLAACPTGSLLVVRVAGVRGYVSAWAEPVGGGERIWYFSAESRSPLVEPAAMVSAATSRAVKIGPEHAAATYLVQVRVTERPMGRDDLLRLPESAALASRQDRLTVTLP